MNNKKKYYEEFVKTQDMKKFVKLLMVKYDMQEKSAKRRWYDVRKLKVRQPSTRQTKYSTKNLRNKNKIYLDEWKQTGNKEDFINLLLKNKPELKRKTAERRYYDVKNIKVEQNNIKNKKEDKKKLPEENKPLNKEKYDKEYKKEVSDMKRLMLQDMLRYNIKITRPYLKKYGFIDYEINWLEDNGFIVLEEDNQW